MGSHSKTTTSVAPPSWAQGTIQNALGSESDAFKQGSGLFNQFQPAITSAIQNTANIASHPPAFQTDAQNQLDKTINGDYLTPGSNPFEAGMAKQIADQTGAGYNASFGGAGRAHGGMAALLSSQGIGNALDNFYGGIYGQERGLQQQATLAEPSLNADQFTGANNLISETQTAAMTPEQLAALYGSSVANTVGQYGTTTQKTSTPFGLGSILGLGLMGASAIPGVGTGISSALGLGGGGMAGLLSGVSGQMAQAPVSLASPQPLNFAPSNISDAYRNVFGGI